MMATTIIVLLQRDGHMKLYRIELFVYCGPSALCDAIKAFMHL